MLIEQPHTLSGIHSGAAAQGDNDVRLELTHSLYAAHNGFYVRIRLNVGINFRMAVFFTLSQVIENLIHIAQLYHSGIGDDKGALNALHLLQVLNRIVFKIDLRRNFKPLHVNSPLGDALLVNQVNGRNVGSRRVVAVGAAAQSQRRGIGVINVTNGALRGRRVGNHTANLHSFTI